MADAKLILPSVLRYGILCWVAAWLDVGNRLLGPSVRLIERARHGTA